ncbi:hypothetical protein J3459_018378 [Metarhizium acridum]|nr:hypothetical protein J3459_018378 [Metarhizium acridum]
MDQPLRETQPLQDPAFLFEDLGWEFSELPEIELHLQEGVADASATVKALHQAAQSCGSSLVNFTCQLTSSKFGGFGTHGLVWASLLNVFYWAGLSETFCLPQHVQDVLR